MITRFVIFARVYVGPPVSRWFPTISALETSEAVLIEDLIAGQIEGKVDRIETYDIGELGRDVSEDIAIALGEPVRRRIAEEGYQLSDDLRDFIETHADLGTVIPAKRFEPARVREDA